MNQNANLIPVPFSGGVDLRSDPRTVVPPKLLVAENVTFETPGAAKKRPGSEVIATATSNLVGQFRGLAVRHAENAEELVSFDGFDVRIGDGVNATTLVASDSSPPTRPARISNASSAFAHGAHASGVTAGFRRGASLHYDLVTASLIAADCATSSDGWTMHAAVDSANNLFVWTANANGSVISTPRHYGTTYSRPRLVAIGTTVLLFVREAGANGIRVSAHTTPFPPTSFAAAIITDSAGSFDVEADVAGSRAVIAWISTTATTVKFGFVSTSGVLSGTVTEGTTGTPTTIAVAVATQFSGGDRRIGVFWGSTASTRLDWRPFNSSGVALVAAVNVTTTLAPTQITAVWLDNGTTLAAVALFFSTAGASRYLDLVHFATQSPVVVSVFVRHSSLMSRAWLWQNGSTWSATTERAAVVVSHDSANQKTYFAMRAVYHSTVPAHYGTIGACLSPANAGGHSSAYTGYLASAQYVSGAGVRIAGCDDSQPMEYTLSESAHIQAVSVDGVLMWAASVVGQYDGDRAMEHGFLLYPEDITSTPSNGAGTLTNNGVYAYRVYFERRTRAGRERSAAVAFTVTLGAADDTVTLTIPTLAHTDNIDITDTLEVPSEGIDVVVYRTTNGGTIFYRVGSVVNNPTADTVSYVDTTPDSSITANEIDYLTQSELQHDPSLACTVIAEVNGRVFTAGGQDPNRVNFSLERETGEPVTFSALNYVVVQSGDGPITGLAALNNALVVFRRRSIAIVSGPGPNNTGLGGEFQAPVIASQEIGCQTPASIVRIPQGVMFQSDDGRIHLLGPEGLKFIGADVETYTTAAAVVSAVAWPERGEVRIGLSDGTVLAYQYRSGGQWSTMNYSVDGAIAACVHNGRYIRVPTGGGTMIAESDSYQKNDKDAADSPSSYSVIIETPWIRLGAMQGSQIVRAILFGGKHDADMRPTVNLYYDYVEAAADVGLAWIPTDAYAGAEGFYQFEVRPRRIRCKAIKIRITVTPATAAEASGFALNEIAIRVEPKSGPKPVAAADRAT